MKKGPSRQKGGDPARERKRGTRDQLKKRRKRKERVARKAGVPLGPHTVTLTAALEADQWL